MNIVSQLLGTFGLIPTHAMGPVEPLTSREKMYWYNVARPPLIATTAPSPADHITARGSQPVATHEARVAGALYAAPELPHYPTLWTPFLESALYYAKIPLNWGRQLWHLKAQIIAAFDVVKHHPLPGGLLTMDHPWVTGINPGSGREIWLENVLFRTERRKGFKGSMASDAEILTRIGKFLAHRLETSVATDEFPQGREGRMPHAINYMHGASHYNSGRLLFNDVQEAIYFLSNPKFIGELERFAREERRELLIILRDKDYDRFDLLFLASQVRTCTMWFANNDGPRKVVGWGNRAPYPVVNPLTGGWVRDVYSLKTAQGRREVVRPPILEGKYFQGNYVGTRVRPRLPEYLLGLLTERRVLKKRGDLLRNSVADPKIPERAKRT